MTYLEVQPDGIIFVIDGMPEEPKCFHELSPSHNICNTMTEGNCACVRYSQALASAPRIPVANHNDAFLRIQDQYMPKGAKEFKLKPGIYQIDCEWVEIIWSKTNTRVAILKESPKEENQEEQRFTIDDMKACWEASDDSWEYDQMIGWMQNYNFNKWIKTRKK